MKELEKLKKQYPNLSSLVILGRHVWGKNYTYAHLSRLAKLHVDKSDYQGVHIDTIIEHLRGLSVKNGKFEMA